MRTTRALFPWMLLLGSGDWNLSVQGQKPDPILQYWLVQVVEASTLQDKINEAGREGYRLAAAAPAPGGTTIAVLQKAADREDTYSYLFLTGNGDAKLEQALNSAGSKGFRLVSRDVAPDWKPGLPRPLSMWMEKGPGPSQNFQYALISFGPKTVLKAGLNPKLWVDFNALDYVKKELTDAESRGFRLVRIISGAALIMEKVAGSPGGTPSTPVGSPPGVQPGTYRTLPNLQGAKLQKKLQEAASGGYCIADIDLLAPAAMWPAILMDKSISSSTDAQAGNCSYEVLQKRDLGDKDFNEAGTRGFRLVPQSTSEYIALQMVQNRQVARLVLKAIFEKGPATNSVFRYRTVSAAQLTELSERLEQAGAEGYRPIRVDTGADGSLVVITEKSEASAPSSAKPGEASEKSHE